MTQPSAADVKALRDRTGAGMMDCKEALAEAEGDIDRAVEILRIKGQASAAKRAGRGTGEGVVSAYIHANDQVGAMVEVIRLVIVSALHPRRGRHIPEPYHLVVMRPRFVRSVRPDIVQQHARRLPVRRRLAQGPSDRDSSSSLPRSLHSLLLRHRPWLMARK